MKIYSISPLTSTNYTNKKNNQPAFGARINNNIVKQLLGKSELPKTISIGTVALSALTVAKNYSDNTDINLQAQDIASLPLGDRIAVRKSLQSSNDKFYQFCRSLLEQPDVLLSSLYDNQDDKESSLPNTLANSLSYHNLEDIYTVFDNDHLRKLYTSVDNNGETPLHLIAKNGDEDRLSMFFDSLPADIIDDCNLTADNLNRLPINMNPDFVIPILEYYYRISDYSIITSLITNRPDDTGESVMFTPDWDLHNFIKDEIDDSNVRFAAYTQKNKEGLTPYQKLQRNNLPDTENIREFMHSNLIDLATNSDLSPELSVELLETNGIEPALSEFLKLKYNNETPAVEAENK